MKILRQPEIIFEHNSLKYLNTIIEKLSFENVLIVTDQGIIDTGIYDKLNKAIRDVTCVSIYSNVKPDPSIELVQELLDYARAKNIQLVIGLGGGSSIDSAKVTAALFTNNKNITDYIGTDLITNNSLPLIAIPTTAGTGSEVTPIAILSDEKEQLKKGIVSEKLIPQYALLDPVLTIGMPKQTTAYTGMDALAHAMEAFTSVNANNYTDAMAQKAIELILNNIETVYENGSNIEAREKMMLGSLMAGIAFANAGVTAIHAFAYPLGGMFHIPHGLANSIMLEPVIRFNSCGGSEKFSKLANIFSENSDSSEEIIKKLKALTVSFNILNSLKELNIPENAVQQLSESAMKVTRLLANNPRKISLEDAFEIYKSIY